MTVTIEILNEIKAEVKRFNKRVDAAIARLKEDSTASYGCKETGAVKRAALDLKNELTKITCTKNP